MKHSASYLTGTIGMTMFRTALAMLPGSLAVSGYNIADTFFVARLGTLPLAAMGFTFPVIMLVGCLFHGIGAGIMATVAHAVGGARHAKAAKLVSSGMILVILISVILGVAGWLSIDWTFRQFGAEGEVMNLIGEYMTTWYLGCATASVSMVGNSLLVAVGDARLSGLLMSLGLVLNVVLDPIFIFGLLGFPKLGIEGAALATVLSQAISAIIIVLALGRRHHLWNFHILTGRIVRTAWAQIIRFAVPATLGMLLMPIGNGVVTRIVAKFGDTAVAGVAAAGRLEVVAFIFPMALGIALMPMIAQNYGARLYSRIHQCRRFAMRFALYLECGVAALYFLLAPWLVRFFTADPHVAAVMTAYLRIIPWGFGLMEIHRYSGFLFTGCGHPRATAWLAALRILALMIPLSLLALHWEWLNGIFWARLTTDLLAGAIGWYLVRRMTRALPADGEIIGGTQAS